MMIDTSIENFGLNCIENERYNYNHFSTFYTCFPEQPRASVSTATRVAKDGDSVTLSCDVTGFPEPIVTWERKVRNYFDSILSYLYIYAHLSPETGMLETY